jgi:hypothetical protein
MEGLKLTTNPPVGKKLSAPALVRSMDRCEAAGPLSVSGHSYAGLEG